MNILYLKLCKKFNINENDPRSKKVFYLSEMYANVYKTGSNDDIETFFIELSDLVSHEVRKL